MFSIILVLLFCGVVGAFAPPPLSYQHGSPAISSSSSSRLEMSVTTTERDTKVQEVLSFAREIGPVGKFASEEDQKKLEAMSQKLVEYSDPTPGETILDGMHDLVYSASEGGSSGVLFGRVSGKVQQEFLDETTFINTVTLGPLKAALRATRSVKNDSTNLVKFHQTTISVFGQTVLEKDIKGGGFWKYLFMGKIVDTDGKEKFIRIMETPSLFVLEQPL
eukprot:CAMPEP_0119008910 /NCGR_PEP_ID=MMETSP1176-20130426/4022_1 /TAXON_ID=265551 /ORGANISM="Synedropsis recta cf, Strain CCMP1620" /LENGTH=219 /DNA_ID=CAMNT_0006961329 /DNA_START=13 /DNA_END=672 /DNA_ORIENTATION=-